MAVRPNGVAAMDAVSATWWGVVVRFARTHARCRARRLPKWSPHTAGDLEHEGLIGAVVGMRQWVAKGRRMSAADWACSRARYAIKTVLRAFNQVVRVPPKVWQAGGGRYTLEPIRESEDPVYAQEAPADPPTDPRTVVDHLLGRLRPTDAAVLRSAFLEGRTHRQIGEDDGVSRRAVGWRVKSACERARELL